MPSFQLSCPETEHISGCQKGRDNLACDRCKRCARNTHIEGKEEKIVQNEVQSHAGHRAQQRKAGAPVRADEERAAGGNGQKGEAGRDQAHVGERIGEDLFGRPEKTHKSGRKKKDQSPDDHALQSEERETGTSKVEGFIGLFAAVADVEIDGGTVAEEDRERAAQKSERIGDRGGGISQKTDPLTYEHLVHHVVKGRDQGSNDAGYSILQQKPSNRSAAQRVCGIFLIRRRLSPGHEGLLSKFLKSFCGR